VGHGGRKRTIRRVTLPSPAPALAGTDHYLLIVSCMVYDVPGTVGLPAGVDLLSTHIYDLINNDPTGLPVGTMIWESLSPFLAPFSRAAAARRQGALARSCRLWRDL